MATATELYRPEVVINFNHPHSTPAPDHPPLPPATIVAAEQDLVIEQAEQELKTLLVIPETLPPASTRAPSIRAPSVAPVPLPPSPDPAQILQPRPEPAAKADFQEGDIEETEVTTATTTRKTIRRRLDQTPSPIPTPEVYQTGTSWVENIPRDEAPAPAPPTASSKQIPGRAISQAPGESMKWPSFGRHSPLDAQTVVDDVDVDTGATTVGGPTAGMPSAALLGSTSGRMSGTKGGLRPIPFVDYMAMLQPVSAPVKTHKSGRPSPPASGQNSRAHASLHAASSNFRAETSSAHHHAGLPPSHRTSPQPHTTPRQTTVNVTVGHSPTMHLSFPAHTTAPGTTATTAVPLPGEASVRSSSSPLPGGGTCVYPATVPLPASDPSSRSHATSALRSSHSQSALRSVSHARSRSQRSVAPTASPSPKSVHPAAEAPKTIVTLSAHLDNDIDGNQHLHAKWHDHQTSNRLDVDLGKQAELEETPKVKKKREKREARAKEKEMEKAERASRAASVTLPSAEPGMGQGGMNSTPYKPVANFPPPKSERYAYPAPVTVIGEQRKKRFDEWFNKDRAPPGMGCMGMGGPPLFSGAQPMYPRPPMSSMGMGMRPPILQPPMGYGPGAMGMGMNRGMFRGGQFGPGM
ncbi:hypothetical protein IAR50_006456 [Cryptococcus sp. DSM 104548]